MVRGTKLPVVISYLGYKSKLSLLQPATTTIFDHNPTHRGFLARWLDKNLISEHLRSREDHQDSEAPRPSPQAPAKLGQRFIFRLVIHPEYLPPRCLLNLHVGGVALGITKPCNCCVQYDSLHKRYVSIVDAIAAISM